MRLGDYAETFYWPTKTGLAPSTLAGYASDYANHVLPRWGDAELSEIRARDIEAWLAPMTHAQAANAKSCLQRILRMAERDDLIAVDPCRKSIALPRRRAPYVPRFLDADQARRLLRGFWGHPLEPWLLVSLTCGLRRCEGCALWWRDIDLREGGVRVDKGLQVVGGEPVEWFTKTPSSVRTVYMPRTATRRLREIRGTGPLVPDGHGARMSPDAIARRYRAHCTREGLPYVPPMYLRHTYVYLAIGAGVPEAVIKEQLGHTESSSMLREHYFWSGKSVSKDAARRLDAYLLE